MRDAVNALILAEMAAYPAPDYTGEMRPLPDAALASASAAIRVRSACAATRLPWFPRYHCAAAQAAGPHSRHPVPPSASQAELARVVSGAPAARVDPRRHDAVDAPAGDAADEPAAWEAACDRARIALEAQELRAINAELGSRYGAEAWKAHVTQLDALVVRRASRREELE